MLPRAGGGLKRARYAPDVLRVFAVIAAALWAVPAAGLDAALYARLLDAHTREVSDIAGTRVDYAALRGAAAADWRRLVASLAESPVADAPRAERLAFWINAYNVLAIDMVVRNAPRRSIRDIGSPLRSVWKRPAGLAAGRRVTLHEIEHDILRSMGEPRIHAAIVCASLSCPPLLREPYRAEALDAQLDASVRRWLADPRKGMRLDRERGVLHLSVIFRWFREDFAAAGGAPAFAQRFAPGETAKWLAAHPPPRIRWLDYDWSLNRL